MAAGCVLLLLMLPRRLSLYLTLNMYWTQERLVRKEEMTDLSEKISPAIFAMPFI